MLFKLAKICAALSACSLLAATISCTGQPSRPRTRNDIQRDREAVDTLYLTADGVRIIAPGTEQGMVVDAKTGKIAFRAWQCNNPQCPGRSVAGDPYVFPLPDPFAYVDEQGEPRVRQPQTPAELQQVEEYYVRKCPACLQRRNLARESEEVRQQYQSWLELHLLPQAKQRLAELDEEYRRYLAAEQQSPGP